MPLRVAVAAAAASLWLDNSSRHWILRQAAEHVARAPGCSVRVGEMAGELGWPVGTFGWWDTVLRYGAGGHCGSTWSTGPFADTGSTVADGPLFSALPIPDDPDDELLLHAEHFWAAATPSAAAAQVASSVVDGGQGAGAAAAAAAAARPETTTTRFCRGGGRLPASSNLRI